MYFNHRMQYIQAGRVEFLHSHIIFSIARRMNLKIKNKLRYESIIFSDNILYVYVRMLHFCVLILWLCSNNVTLMKSRIKWYGRRITNLKLRNDKIVMDNNNSSWWDNDWNLLDSFERLQDVLNQWHLRRAAQTQHIEVALLQLLIPSLIALLLGCHKIPCLWFLISKYHFYTTCNPTPQKQQLEPNETPLLDSTIKFWKQVSDFCFWNLSEEISQKVIAKEYFEGG